MRVAACIAGVVGALLSWNGVAWSGGDDGRAIVARAIQAAGGEANLKKFHAMTWSEKGTYYGMGDGLPYASKCAVHYPDQFRMDVLGVFTTCVNGDTGWIDAGGKVRDMTKDELVSERTNHRAGAIASLVPLKNKAFEVKSLGGDDAVVVEVSRKDYPTTKLYFDKTTNLLIRSEWRSKAADQQFKEVAMEMNFSNFKDVEGCKIAHTLVLKRDGKAFVEAEMHDIKAGHPEAKTFAKPAQ